MTDELPKPPPKSQRPLRGEPGANVATWLPVSDFEKLCKAAKARDVSVSALVRDLLQKQIK
jgi:hypothetical protein